ncbi:MAG: fructose-6-phosphate aldolase [Candidatus Scalindua sp. AMX11]|nr:MAG: fructose-6-phosphate aldolase [Candidatus Scalindua sp.]NOG85124.1 fructose-6-phosphate aldolase [Planctomycetota bacterium]RZV69294.1 MAG: fructose-6-phosphate aldolase [Candidatus Scalindua sp. SCAELEC01]TDE66795.1 MAG: fructose-6-phosphate aldolase [Candidatus Scalindua sp. AMX11]GJQ60411.1 MAG: putative transaldolase [Candidatus Scalindua sp.]
MKFFIDTADVDQIREAESLGILDGVTTNPTLVSKTGRPFKEILEEICLIVKGPVSAEVVSTDVEGILQEGRDLAKIAENIVVKVPLIKEGLKAVKILTSEGIRVNVTLCFSSNQALLAAKVGATYISPFVGRLDDKGHTGMEVIEEIRTIYDNYGFETQIIVASVRTPLHVRDSALMGADIATIPFDVFNKIVQHPLTDDGLKNFLADWEKVPK